MLGFGAIGEFALGEFNDGVTELVVSNVVSNAVQPAAPDVGSGASVGVPSVSMGITTHAPSVARGTRVLPGHVIDGITPLEPRISISATITVPSHVSQAALPNVPAVYSGAMVASASQNLSDVPQDPSVASGGSVLSPIQENQAQPYPILVSIGANVNVPQSNSMGFELFVPAIRAGNSVYWQSEEFATSYIGGTGEGAIGEFAIGEGEESQVLVFRIPRYMIRPRTPFVSAGKSVSPPAMNNYSVPYAIEVGARRRKLRVWAISS